jgi:class 3 adenylate cyclase
MRKDPIAAITKMLLHNKMCRNIVEKNNGIVIKELGDAILVTFKSAGLACECAIKVIRNLKRQGKGIRTKVTVASGTLWKIKTTTEDDVYGIPVNLCTRMSQYAKEDCILFEENAYVAVQNWLLDDKKIRYNKVKQKGKDLKLNDFGLTPMRKIIVN